MRGEQYLTRAAQYGLVYNKGRSWVSKLVVMKTLPNELEISRYGFSVSRRVGASVVRNRVKRLFREILRRVPLQPGWDIIFIVRSPAAKANYIELEKLVKHLLLRASIISEGA